jgi:hypothetical protein
VRPRLPSVAAIALAALAAAPAASAHGPFGPAHGYVSSVSSIQPNVLGLEARVVGDQLLLRNWSGKTVTILAPDGVPYLRFGRGGVYLNSGPKWQRVSGGTSFSWHDPRVAWLGKRPPKVVDRDPNRSHFLRFWSVPGTAAGRRFVIHGLLGYAPPPRSKDDSVAWTTWLGVAAAGLAAAAGGALLVRRSRSRPRATGSDPAEST